MEKRTLEIGNYPNKKCSCGSELYDTTNVVKEIPPLVVGNRDPVPMLAPVVVCRKCGHIRYVIPSYDLPTLLPYVKPDLRGE